MAELLLSKAFTHLRFSDLTVAWWSKQENKTTDGVKLYNLTYISKLVKHLKNIFYLRTRDQSEKN